MEGLPNGGSEFLWTRAAARLLDGGNVVACSIRRWPFIQHHVVDLQRRGCQVHFRTTPAPFGRRILRRLGIGQNSDWRWLHQFGPELVVISLGIHLEGIEPAAECRKYGFPYVLVVQSADEHRWPTDQYLHLLRESYIGAIACFFISRHNREIVEDQLATCLANARFVRNPYNVSMDARPPWPKTECLRLACVGTMAPVQKAQDLVIRVLANRRWLDRPVEVTFYGSGQNDITVRRLVERHKLERCTFGGFTHDIEGIWANHHGLILPSRHEGMPIVTVEAMLCGRVCIVTDVGSNAEFIDDEKNGFLVPAPTVPLLDQTLERAWGRLADWQVIGEEAAQTIRKRMPPDPVGAFIGELEQCLIKAK